MRHQDPSVAVVEHVAVSSHADSKTAPSIQEANTHSEPGPASSFALLGRLKSAVNEVLSTLGAQGNNFTVDDFLTVAEEFLKELKIVKMERRIESRRANIRVNNLATPLIREAADEVEDQPSTPAAAAAHPKSYIAALMMLKKVSPKRAAFKPEVTRYNVEAARHASALRSEERRRQAEERRLDYLYEIKSRSEAAEARGMRAKARREEAVMRQRLESKDRMENVLRRAEENRKQTVEKAQRAYCRVEEVRLANELRQQTKALLLDKKMSDVEQNQEARREARQRQAQDRRDAMTAAAERRRNLSEERAEKQQQRELQRQENLRRVEEQKKMEIEIKQQKAEEWEKKVHRRQEDAHAEAEALSRKTEEKFQLSAQVLEEQREKRRQKLEKQEKKLQEAKSRRAKEAETSTTVSFLPILTPQEEEQMSQKLSKFVTSSSRQGNVFCDQYQRDCLLCAKDLNRSKLRSLSSRLAASIAVPSVSQCKPIMREIMAIELIDIDHEYIRYFRAFETVVKVISEGRKARDELITKEATDFLQTLFTHPEEGRNHAAYFVRSGIIVSLVLTIREELKTLRHTYNASLLKCMLSTISVCLDCLCSDTQPKFAGVRDQLLHDLDATGLDRACQVIIRMCCSEKDLDLAYGALRIIHTELSVFGKRKINSKLPYFQSTTSALFLLLQNLLTPDGIPIQAGSDTVSCERMTVLFGAFRCLNMVARWQLTAFQELLHDLPPPALSSKEEEASSPFDARNAQITRMEVFHALNGFFAYIQEHSEHLEALPSVTELVAVAEQTPSSLEMGKFGISLQYLPAYPTAEGAPAYLPGGRLYPFRAALHECILLVGYLCLDDTVLQDMLTWGKGKTLLCNMLSVLPIQYFSNARHILFPSLLAAIHDNPRNMLLVSTEIDVKQLHSFLSEEYGALSKKGRLYADEHYRQLKAYRLASDPERAQREAFFSQSVKSWVCMTDDDDMISKLSIPEVDPHGTTPLLEKEKLCRAFRSSGTMSSNNFYRIERRLPITYWPGSLETLEKEMQRLR